MKGCRVSLSPEGWGLVAHGLYRGACGAEPPEPLPHVPASGLLAIPSAAGMCLQDTARGTGKRVMHRDSAPEVDPHG